VPSFRVAPPTRAAAAPPAPDRAARRHRSSRAPGPGGPRGRRRRRQRRWPPLPAARRSGAPRRQERSNPVCLGDYRGRSEGLSALGAWDEGVDEEPSAPLRETFVPSGDHSSPPDGEPPAIREGLSVDLGRAPANPKGSSAISEDRGLYSEATGGDSAALSVALEPVDANHGGRSICLRRSSIYCERSEFNSEGSELISKRSQFNSLERGAPALSAPVPIRRLKVGSRLTSFPTVCVGGSCESLETPLEGTEIAPKAPVHIDVRSEYMRERPELNSERSRVARKPCVSRGIRFLGWGEGIRTAAGLEDLVLDASGAQVRRLGSARSR